MAKLTLETAVATGLLDPDEHGPLIDRLPHWARVAGIQPEDVFRSPTSVLTTEEIRWSEKWREACQLGKYGLCYVGPFARPETPDVALRMRALTGTFLRGFIDARIQTVAACTGFGADDPSVLLIPDAGEDHNPQTQRMLGAKLIDRARQCRPSVLHFLTLKDVERLLGSSAAGLVMNQFLHIQV